MGGSQRKADAREPARVAPGSDERVLRRALGPTAWAVLADLCLEAEADGIGTHVVATSARLVSAHLGIAKDTAARALRRLGAAGIGRRRPQGTSPAGRVTAGTNELRLPSSVTPLPCPAREDTVHEPRRDRVDTASMAVSVSLPAATVSAPARRRNRATTASSAQLSLLDPVPEEIGVGEVGRWR